MIDIHAHYLPYVDDGSPSMEDSLNMLNVAYSQGVTDIICTPHLRGRFKASEEEVSGVLSKLQSEMQKRNIPVNLYLGREIYFGKNEKDLSGSYATLAGSKYLLCEFGTEEEIEVYELVFNALKKGYVPIIAHVERYDYLSENYISDLRSIGALIQINAGSVAGPEKKYNGKRVKSLLKSGLVDFVASDCHLMRKNWMAKAKKTVEKKYGKEYAGLLFEKNALKILGKGN